MNSKRNWRKRTNWAITLSCVLALAASGCSSGGTVATDNGVGSKDKPGTAPANDSKPLQMQIFGGLYNEMPDMNNAFWTEWQKRLNVKLDANWVPSGDVITKLDLVLSSGDIPEVIAYPNQGLTVTMINAIRNGAFWDLTPFLGDMSQYPNLKNNTPPNWQKFLAVDGKTYALPRSRSLIDNSINIRKDWLDKLNIPVPTTLDEYRDALRAISNGDPDGNGKKDTMGIVGTNEGVSPFEAGFGAYSPHYDSEGGLIWHELTNEYTNLVEYFRGLYADGSMPKEYMTMKRTQMEEAIGTGKAATYMRSTRYHYDFELQAKKVQPEAKIIALPPLKGPGGYAVDLSTGVNGGIFISKKVPEAKLKQMLKYFEATASQEITDFGYSGVEGIHYKMVNGQKVPTELSVKEVNTTSLGAGVFAYVKWGKVDNPGAPKEYVEQKRKEVAEYEKIGVYNIFTWLISNEWVDTWPKYSNEWQSMMTKAIVGQISMDEYKTYVSKLNNLPEFKQAYKEFAKAYSFYK
ncbi:extracellular solute-binding protein [Paenibacillus radicis (ex Xue et al. 2023)]|uniref:Extracellular solute-binding protein n=1 Tax=Paenibacillus radicis (ex Xue et al. 2023) TaxID=2972489 RepID=A0ABT1YFR6_9BACL|nr:extracellular solute-binding protein [Paenibacillus radicis (ex Xue et al. 2023)]MCR8632036.1 extracellular solute-binding protein [Paenibacillus radicis (ex Xue et al. 2023)]